jgi:hypothetical protein
MDSRWELASRTGVLYVMKTIEKQLSEIKSEIAVGRRLVTKEKKKAKSKKQKADPVRKQNAKRVLKTLEKGVEALEDRRETLTKQAEADDFH